MHEQWAADVIRRTRCSVVRDIAPVSLWLHFYDNFLYRLQLKLLHLNPPPYMPVILESGFVTSNVRTRIQPFRFPSVEKYWKMYNLIIFSFTKCN